MEFKGTPGPWSHADSCGLNETAGGAIHGDGKTLCLILGKGIGKEKATANAKLMAAAPEMLDALIKIVGMNQQYAIDKYGDVRKAEEMACVRTARAAINKALGRE
ncbi:hypothetical protein [Morganella morganii]|uniref:hypothetical protein n=1 Tax=Morganella morganii TaxID=582 RepID=UPI000F819DA9|nr:hypothetical protein [Morganella morganii]MBT0403661.1 hypothetical protein [Morganella morganii subsp. morganii]RTY34593.1 hypothetical protein EKS33_02810 [Morganella morganii subsp. morganii]HEI8864299.1 hypothetical protein [Morganella morganii]